MTAKCRIFGIVLDAISMEVATSRLIQWLESPRSQCRYVVTPNVDHVVKLRSSPAFMAAYAGASMVLADGKPLVLASRLMGKELKETVPGSDLVPGLFRKARSMRHPMKIFLLGAGPGVANRAALAITQRWPNVQIVGTYSPPLGFEALPSECEQIIEKIAATEPDVLIVGLGAPKQELWVHKYRTRINAKVAICAGATIDFIAGEKARAPIWMRKAGLEWLHRVGSEPRRLLRRYAHDAVIFPTLLVRELFGGAVSRDD
ncbi:MAG TPA: WecB/TagA/CpsF family glycosyltransferase [Paraburkholderia sp.]|uniref:WecB/TagA/CpsF family glycosyltransferase n=1 Tax=Paraburkholderia sp. TaxID=1926495 RepID=UPI002B45B01A|nr:WecB/TagA/CpsF family glycosyltransferase [Paraburkholderia sp.]HKR46943.1 WecB/TagA/CpsF family glycosyltransferase [Paraburkholderia sp.]